MTTPIAEPFIVPVTDQPPSDDGDDESPDRFGGGGGSPAIGEKGYLTKEDFALHMDAVERRKIHEQRLRYEAARADCKFRVFGAALLMLAASGLIAGTILVSEAESDRLHGWRQTECRINRNFALHHHPHEIEPPNATATGQEPYPDICVYFSVTYRDAADGSNHSACAVPAAIAGHGDLADPPACAALPRHDVHVVHWWRDIGDDTGIMVDCVVPVHSTIPADRCVAAATTGGPGPALWRTWLDRFVYLVRDPREATEALALATRIQRDGGILLIAGAGVLFLLAIGLLFRRACARISSGCIEAKHHVHRQRLDRQAREHKLH